MRWFAIDLDGTLLNKKHQISETNRTAIKRRQDQGDVVVIVTGRAAFDAQRILDQHGLDCPVIGANGAEIEIGNPKRHFLDCSSSRTIWEVVRSTNVFIHIYLQDRILLPQYSLAGLQGGGSAFQEAIQAQVTQQGVETVDAITVDQLDIIKFMFVSPSHKNEWYADRFYSFEDGQALAGQLLTADLPDAMIVGNDEVAAGLIHQFRQHGVRIPEDIAITGFDDVPIARALEITTIRQPVVMHGRLAAEQLLSDELKHSEGTFSLLEPSLIIRQTT
ncbi:HAD-IIB family hydrolase [Exiguobacterium sp. BMC-KP]|uniref:HAD-IIB family hydrolase n=1 Tax=Exiguobacterium sp. BMC-KP TaxID=1684312 RepID=UPI0006AA52B0|nr:HAD-IIB family hydrolase [Exiguobacterium sp. BMC-KP]